MPTPAWGTSGASPATKEITREGLIEYGRLHPWAGARRIPLPKPAGSCTLDDGLAVSQVWFAEGSIRALCADHDPSWLPLPAVQPSWWRHPWPYGPPPSYGARVAAWLRAFPLPRRGRTR